MRGFDGVPAVIDGQPDVVAQPSEQIGARFHEEERVGTLDQETPHDGAVPDGDGVVGEGTVYQCRKKCLANALLILVHVVILGCCCSTRISDGIN